MWRFVFNRSGGCWLFWLSAIYLVVGMFDIFFLKEDYYMIIQLTWLVLMMLPLVCKPLARWLNMSTVWEIL